MSLNRIEVAFDRFTKGDPAGIDSLDAVDVGYLRHALQKARDAGDASTSGHPLFLRWQLEGHGEEVQPFLLEVAKRKGLTK